MAKSEAMLPTSRGTVALVNLVESPMAQRGAQARSCSPSWRGAHGSSVASCRPGRSTQTWSVSYPLMGKASSISSTTVQVQACDAQPTPFHHSA